MLAILLFSFDVTQTFHTLRYIVCIEKKKKTTGELMLWLGKQKAADQ